LPEPKRSLRSIWEGGGGSLRCRGVRTPTWRDIHPSTGIVPETTSSLVFLLDSPCRNVPNVCKNNLPPEDSASTIPHGASHIPAPHELHPPSSCRYPGQMLCLWGLFSGSFVPCTLILNISAIVFVLRTTRISQKSRLSAEIFDMAGHRNRVFKRSMLLNVWNRSFWGIFSAQAGSGDCVKGGDLRSYVS
jgi:hypothetical protein